MEQAQTFTGQAFTNMSNLVMPSHPTRVKALKGNNGNFEIGKGLYSYV